MTAYLFSLLLQMALAGVEVNLGQLDKDIVWVRWTGTPVCWYIDLSLRKAGPKLPTWGRAYDAIYLTQQYHILKGNVRPADPSSRPLCDAPFGTDTSTLYPSVIIAPILPPQVFRVVPAGTATTRPMYNADLWALKGQWSRIGEVERDTICETDIQRITTLTYHYVTNKAGLRGIAACR